MRSMLITLAKLTTPGALLLVDWLRASLSPHALAVVVVTSFLVDVYSTVIEWLTSDRPRAAQPTSDEKEFNWSIGYDTLSYEPRTNSTPYRTQTVIPVGSGGSSSSPTISIVMKKNRMAKGMCMLFLRPGEHRTGFVEPTRERETGPGKQKHICIVVSIQQTYW